MFKWGFDRSNVSLAIIIVVSLLFLGVQIYYFFLFR